MLVPRDAMGSHHSWKDPCLVDAFQVGDTWGAVKNRASDLVTFFSTDAIISTLTYKRQISKETTGAHVRGFHCQREL